MTYFVTGATGFIGRYLVQSLLRDAARAASGRGEILHGDALIIDAQPAGFGVGFRRRDILRRGVDGADHVDLVTPAADRHGLQRDDVVLTVLLEDIVELDHVVAHALVEASSSTGMG